ncbi:hypothetical protein FRB96_003972 [Tulasnella sp. 330]|nr:hypothetical protein FRB96_003972 [Tulasnella sp. 330]
MAPPAADLVIVFNATAKSKPEALEAEKDYSALIARLRHGGFKAVGRRGNKDAQVLIFISASDQLLAKIIQEERYRDFINGVPSFNIPSVARNFGADPLTNSERVRFTHSYMTGALIDNGLGVAPDAEGCSRVKSIMALHDHEFNEQWVDSWMTRKLGLGFREEEIEKIKAQFGEQLALYFAFLSFYSRALIFPGALGAVMFFLAPPFHPAYSTLISLWSIFFVEAWRIRERTLSVIWGSYGCERVERRRSEFKGAGDASEVSDDSLFPWWKRELRVMAGLPVIAFFATALFVVLTLIFIVEAFVTQLYTGPGVQYVGLVPTGMFMLLVPRLVGYYQSFATWMTNWENHVHQGTYNKSLSLKTFALADIVAYGGLYLSAFVYVPFGEQIMAVVQATVFTAQEKSAGAQKVTAMHTAKKALNPDRLKNQVFAYLVTNQVVGQFLELGVPFLMRMFGNVKEGKTPLSGKSRKTVAWEDEKKDDASRAAITGPRAAAMRQAEEENEFVADVRSQVALPDYDVFGDYSEMVTQFGYVVLWSTCWFLAPIGALVNNWFELRGDAIKVSKFGRRPIPRRVDSIGSWVDIIGYLTWQGALVNSALVYLFYHPIDGTTVVSKIYSMGDNNANSTSGTTREDARFLTSSLESSAASTLSSMLYPALFIALSTSHAYFIVRVFVRHLLERALWRGSAAQVKLEKSEKDVKRSWLKDVGGGAKIEGTGEVTTGGTGNGTSGEGMPLSFWEDDQGLTEDAEIALMNHWRIDPVRLSMQDDILGYGGYGTVRMGHLSRPSDVPLKVAVKALRSRCEEMDVQVAFSLVREMKVWASLSHPNVLPFIGFHLSPNLDNALLISPFAAYGSILKYIRKAKPDEFKRLQLAIQILDGLAYLHTKDPPICHGDLKGDNIFVDGLGNAMLGDFGLATVLQDEPSRLTTDVEDGAVFKGSIRYSSPEVLDGEGKSIASDIWAWGCLLLEILTDTPPYSDVPTDLQVIRRVWEGGFPEQPHKITRLFQIGDVLRKCWDQDATRRPHAGRCYLLLQPWLKFILGKRITCRLNHPTPTRWSDSTWSVQAQALSIMPRPVYDTNTTKVLANGLDDLAGRLENIHMMEEASCARFAASNLRGHLVQENPSSPITESSGVDGAEARELAYMTYKYLYTLHIQNQELRFAPPRESRCLPLEGDGHEKASASTIDRASSPPPKQLRPGDSAGLSLLENSCTICDEFVDRLPSREYNDINLATHGFSDQWCDAMGIDSNRRKKLVRYQRKPANLYLRRYQEAPAVPPSHQEAPAALPSHHKEPDPPTPFMDFTARGVDVITWAIQHGAQGDRATVKEICDLLISQHPDYAWIITSTAANTLSTAVRKLLGGAALCDSQRKGKWDDMITPR